MAEVDGDDDVVPTIPDLEEEAAGRPEPQTGRGGEGEVPDGKQTTENGKRKTEHGRQKRETWETEGAQTESGDRTPASGVSDVCFLRSELFAERAERFHPTFRSGGGAETAAWHVSAVASLPKHVSALAAF